LITIHRPLIKVVCGQNRAQHYFEIIRSAELGSLIRLNEVARPAAGGLAFALPDGRHRYVSGCIYVQSVFARFL